MIVGWEDPILNQDPDMKQNDEPLPKNTFEGSVVERKEFSLTVSTEVMPIASIGVGCGSVGIIP